MVRIRVAARIFPEDEYLKNIRLGKSIAAPVRGEKRLVVIVRDPYQWQIGTLLLEIKRSYESCYGRALPTVKYLKDADDFDISPQSYVSDVLLDEGRAQTDASDQRVTVNVVAEQGRAVREGSVAVGSQLEDPRYHMQLEQTSRPPIPTFSGLPSSLGKRPFAPADQQPPPAIGAKRARRIDIPETLSEGHQVVSSIEHDESPEPIDMVVEATQYSNPDKEHTRHQSTVEPTIGSPESGRLLQKVSSPAIEQPLDSSSSKKGKEDSTQTQSSPSVGKVNGISKPTANLGQRLQEQLQAPVTPPSETSRRQSNPGSLQRRRSDDAAKSSAQLSSASARKFKRKDVYDYPESDIDDSQMSPRSRQAQLGHGKSHDRLSHIEDIKSPRDDRGDHALSISQAIDTLDNESVFDDERPVEEAFKTPEVISRKTSSSPDEETETSTYEDPETGDAVVSGQGETAEEPVKRAASNSVQVNGHKRGASSTAALQPKQDAAAAASEAKDKKALALTKRTQVDKQPNSVKADGNTGSRPPRQKKRPRNDSVSVDGDARSSVKDSGNRSTHSNAVNTKKSTAKRQKSSTRTSKGSRTSVSSDSPGGQLSQDLRESAEQSSMNTLKKNVVDEREKPTATPGGQAKKAVAVGSSQKAQLKTPNGGSSKQNASTGSREKTVKVLPATNQVSSPPQSIVVQRGQEQAGSSSGPTKPLPNWGSEAPFPVVNEQTAAKGREDRLNVDKQGDSRKSPSIGIGLTAEEIKTMESRKNMTKEQYEAEKKRKQQEARKQAAAAKKMPATDQSLVNQGRKASEPQVEDVGPATTSTRNKPRKSLSSEEHQRPSPQAKTTDVSVVTSQTGKSKTPTMNSTPGGATSIRRESTGASSSKTSNAEHMLPPKTPAKTATKTPPAKSAITNKTPKPSAQQSNAAIRPAKTSSKSPSVKSMALSKTPKAASQQSPAEGTLNKVTKKPAPASSTNTKTNAKVVTNIQSRTTPAAGPYNQRLSDLHEVVRSAKKAPEPSQGTLLARIKQSQKPPVFEVDDEDEDESESSDDDEKPQAAAKVVATPNKIKTPNKQRPLEDEEDDDSSSQNENAKPAANGRLLLAGRNVKGKPTSTPSGRPDPTIRDQSIESDDEDEEDDD
ncbi:hypothetical protein PV04_00165 [Phialophora macrospora]|uniref:Nucleolar protein Dnt1-like N-terminal domain-containing protein n=1 Tax=Phialophora macrospora TaxID=1851006 RepID=A0A0D2GI04_9EURO|nr:hypothetical protein PV04_00165 [Phialophora macrospora]